MYYIWKLIRLLLLPLFVILRKYNKAECIPFEYINSDIGYSQCTAYDCETVAILSALYSRESKDNAQVLYDNINRALLRCECLGWLQNPLYGNPWNVRCALEELGYKVENIDPKDIKDNDKAIMLIHLNNDSLVNHILFQHWIAYGGKNRWHFGDGVMFHELSDDMVKKYWSCRVYPTCYVIRKKVPLN